MFQCEHRCWVTKLNRRLRDGIKCWILTSFEFIMCAVNTSLYKCNIYVNVSTFSSIQISYAHFALIPFQHNAQGTPEYEHFLCSFRYLSTFSFFISVSDVGRYVYRIPAGGYTLCIYKTYVCVVQ